MRQYDYYTSVSVADVIGHARNMWGAAIKVAPPSAKTVGTVEVSGETVTLYKGPSRRGRAVYYTARQIGDGPTRWGECFRSPVFKAGAILK